MGEADLGAENTEGAVPCRRIALKSRQKIVYFLREGEFGPVHPAGKGEEPSGVNREFFISINPSQLSLIVKLLPHNKQKTGKLLKLLD